MVQAVCHRMLSGPRQLHNANPQALRLPEADRSLSGTDLVPRSLPEMSSLMSPANAPRLAQYGLADRSQLDTLYPEALLAAGDS